MYNFIYDPKNNVNYFSYFDVHAGDGNHQLEPQNGTVLQFPASSALFKQLFGSAPYPTSAPTSNTGTSNGGNSNATQSNAQGVTNSQTVLHSQTTVTNAGLKIQFDL